MSQPDSLALFTYGSLMFEPVWQKVTCLTSGPAAKPRPARLAGFSRHAVAGQTYPALLRNQDHFVDGALYQQVPGHIIARLDRFEGRDYQRITGVVQLTQGADAESLVFEADQNWPGSGNTLQAEVYLFVATSGAQSDPWSVQSFVATGMTEFIAQYVGFNDV